MKFQIKAAVAILPLFFYASLGYASNLLGKAPVVLTRSLEPLLYQGQSSAETFYFLFGQFTSRYNSFLPALPTPDDLPPASGPRFFLPPIPEKAIHSEQKKRFKDAYQAFFRNSAGELRRPAWATPELLNEELTLPWNQALEKPRFVEGSDPVSDVVLVVAGSKYPLHIRRDAASKIVPNKQVWSDEERLWLRISHLFFFERIYRQADGSEMISRLPFGQDPLEVLDFSILYELDKILYNRVFGAGEPIELFDEVEIRIGQDSLKLPVSQRFKRAAKLAEDMRTFLGQVHLKELENKAKEQSLQTAKAFLYAGLVRAFNDWTVPGETHLNEEVFFIWTQAQLGIGKAFSMPDYASLLESKLVPVGSMMWDMMVQLARSPDPAVQAIAYYAYQICKEYSKALKDRNDASLHPALSHHKGRFGVATIARRSLVQFSLSSNLFHIEDAHFRQMAALKERLPQPWAASEFAQHLVGSNYVLDLSKNKEGFWRSLPEGSHLPDVLRYYLRAHLLIAMGSNSEKTLLEKATSLVGDLQSFVKFGGKTSITMGVLGEPLMMGALAQRQSEAALERLSAFLQRVQLKKNAPPIAHARMLAIEYELNRLFPSQREASDLIFRDPSWVQEHAGVKVQAQVSAPTADLEETAFAALSRDLEARAAAIASPQPPKAFDLSPLDKAKLKEFLENASLSAECFQILVRYQNFSLTPESRSLVDRSKNKMRERILTMPLEQLRRELSSAQSKAQSWMTRLDRNEALSLIALSDEVWEGRIAEACGFLKEVPLESLVSAQILTSVQAAEIQKKQEQLQEGLESLKRTHQAARQKLKDLGNSLESEMVRLHQLREDLEKVPYQLAGAESEAQPQSIKRILDSELSASDLGIDAGRMEQMRADFDFLKTLVGLSSAMSKRAGTLLKFMSTQGISFSLFSSYTILGNGSGATDSPLDRHEKTDRQAELLLQLQKEHPSFFLYIAKRILGDSWLDELKRLYSPKIIPLGFVDEVAFENIESLLQETLQRLHQDLWAQIRQHSEVLYPGEPNKVFLEYCKQFAPGDPVCRSEPYLKPAYAVSFFGSALTLISFKHDKTFALGREFIGGKPSYLTESLAIHQLNPRYFALLEQVRTKKDKSSFGDLSELLLQVYDPGTQLKHVGYYKMQWEESKGISDHDLLIYSNLLPLYLNLTREFIHDGRKRDGKSIWTPGFLGGRKPLLRGSDGGVLTLKRTNPILITLEDLMENLLPEEKAFFKPLEDFLQRWSEVVQRPVNLSFSTDLYGNSPSPTPAGRDFEMRKHFFNTKVREVLLPGNLPN